MAARRRDEGAFLRWRRVPRSTEGVAPAFFNAVSRVNTIAPGIVETPMLATVSDEFRSRLAAGVPFPQRLGRPDEYAQLALSIIEHDYWQEPTR